MPDTETHPLSIVTDVVILALAVAVLIFVIRSFRKRSSLLDFQPRNPVPWGLVDIGLILLAMILSEAGMLSITTGIQSLYGLSADSEGADIYQQMTRMMASSASKLITLFTGLAVLCVRCKSTDEDVGWSWGGVPRDLKQGVTAFLLMVVPVFAIQFVLSLFFEPEHPIITLLLETPSPMFFAICGVMAVFVAPVVEEFLFRVVIQGWLENVAVYWKTKGQLRERVNYAQVILGGNMPTMLDGETNDENSLKIAPSWWPIIASSMLFALAHLGNSTDPIPLFVFACGLGYLYQRTHRILPCIVVHMLLNSISTWKLWLLVKASQ